jgi:hypothetical protein
MPVVRPFVLIAFSCVSIFFGLALPGTSTAQDVRHVCSEKYQAAKAAGTLGDETWPKFYSRCAAEIKANPPAAASPAAEAAPAPLDIRHLCSEKYQAAKAAGTLGGESWPQFYSRCTAEAKANPPAAAPPAAATAAPEEEKAPEAPPPAPVVEAPTPPPPAPVAEAPPPPPPATVNPLKKPAAKPVAPAAPAAPSTAVFPTAVAPEFAKEKPGKARMKTCDAQYKANKATNANGGLKWIQKGGGYWSECNKRLKGSG